MKKLFLLLAVLSGALSTLAQVKTSRMLDGIRVVTVSGAIQTTDVTKLLVFNCASACAITLPAATTAGFGVGSIFSVRSVGVGTATISGNISNVPLGSGTSGASLILTTNQGTDLYSSGTDYQMDGITNSGALAFAGVPSGTCVGAQLAMNTTNGFVYGCGSGVWVLAGGAISFANVTPGTNTGALVMGTGGSFSASGSGTITATAVAAAGVIPGAFAAGAYTIPTGATLARSGTGSIDANTVNTNTYPAAAALVSGGLGCATSTSIMSTSVAVSSNTMPKGGGPGACPTNSSVTDNGTTVSTAEPIVTTSTISTGSTPPACAPGTAGSTCYGEGTAPTAVALVDDLWGDSAAHELKAHVNGGGAGLIPMVRPSPIHLTAQTAAIGTATLCTSAAGACNQAGMYHVHWDFIETGTACSNVTAGSVTFLLTWTDSNATAHAAVALQMMTQTGAATTAIAGSWPFATALANSSAGGDFNISTNGTVIQYATGYTACTTGTGTYQLDAAVTRIQ